MREGGYESLRTVVASVEGAQATPEARRLVAKASVYGAIRFPDSSDFGTDAAAAQVAALGDDESLDATLAKAGLALLQKGPEQALAGLPAEGGASAEAHWLKGLAHEKAGQPVRATEAFDAALQADADFAPAAAGLGRVALARTDPEAAAPWLLRAHRLAPAQGPSGLLAADALSQIGRDGEASRVRLGVARHVEGLPPDQRAPLLASVAAAHDAKGRIEEVADLALEAARLSPADAEVGALAALAEVAKGNPQAGLQRVEGHLKRAPEHVPSLIARARIQMALQDVAKAFLDLEAAEEVAPRSWEAPLWRGRFNVQLGKMQDAREAFRIAVARAGDEAQPKLSLGRLELDEGDVDQAFELAKDAVRAAPQDARVRLLLADCLAERGQRDKALQAYTAAASEGLLSAALGRANMLRDQAERTRSPAESEALGAAMAQYIRAWQAQPEDPKVLFELGRALELEGQLGNALALYGRAASLDAEDVRPHLRMAAAFMEPTPPDLHAAGASLRAAKAIERRLGLNEPAVRFWEARVDLARGRIDEAVSNMREAVEAEPKNSVYQYWLGRSLEQDNSLYEAVAAYEEAVQLNSRFADAQRALGSTALEQNRFRTARRWFNEYRKNEPTDGTIYIDIGTSFTKQNKDGPALRAFRRALEFDPDNTTALLNVGNILSRRGREAQATRMFAKAVESSPDHPEAVCLLGISQATRRVLPETKQYLERCQSMEEAPQDLRETAEDILLTPR